MHIITAHLERFDLIRAELSGAPSGITIADILLAPAAEVVSLAVEGRSLLIEVRDLRMSQGYTLLLRGVGMSTIDTNPWLEMQCPNGPLGCVTENGVNVFRLFAPRASAVRLQLYDSVSDTTSGSWDMERRGDGVWEIAVPLDQREVLYTYSIVGSRRAGESFNSRIPVADPYGRAVVSQNTFRHASKTIVPSSLPVFDWEGDRHVVVAQEDLVIYELHVRDITAHPSSGVAGALAGTYLGLADESACGGLAHIRSLGVNAIELLPCQHYAWMEPPYLRHAGEDIYNHWNPWERNHWGYMTSYYFSPEPRYATGANLEEGFWNDLEARHLNEFREMIKRLHTAGLAVILDVVFNHTSQYDYQPLKYIDKKYYYHLDEHGGFRSDSGCGNDVNTSAPAMRKLIVDCIAYWIEEFHIDGFRFDLAAMIDSVTLEAIRDEARKRFPGVILIAEPWGANLYNPAGFSALDYLSWNDIFRNGVKGSDPVHHQGYIFGNWGGSRAEAFGMWMLGSITEKGGPFLSHAHSVNYLESHDGYTLADFIRIATGAARPGQPIGDMDAYRKLTGRALEISKLAALVLLTSRGAVMMHAGQEFGRGKVVADKGIADIIPRVIDYNSYEKDDETNWIDYTYADVNASLLAYYRGLIAIRREYPQLRRSDVKKYQFFVPDAAVAGGFVIQEDNGNEDIAILINANHSQSARYKVGGGSVWHVLADAEKASTTPLRTIRGDLVTVPPCSGMILRRRSLTARVNAQEEEK